MSASPFRVGAAIRTARRAAVALVGTGCWSSPTSSSPERRTTSSLESAGELAERTLRADAPFELALPGRVPPPRDAAANALVRACRAGHHPSCWVLLHVAPTERALEIGLADVTSQCAKGDLASCQAIPPLPAHPRLPPNLPGELGRTMFQKSRAPTEHEAAQLRAECGDGFAYSCQVLAERSPDRAERREMRGETSRAAREGCRRKIPDACALVDAGWPTVDRLAALDWNCQIRRSECHRLGAALLALGRLDDARNEYERACQYGRKPARCLELAELYSTGKLIEPVPGRRISILQLACASLEADGDAGDYPECAPSP